MLFSVMRLYRLESEEDAWTLAHFWVGLRLCGLVGLFYAWEELQEYCEKHIWFSIWLGTLVFLIHRKLVRVFIEKAKVVYSWDSSTSPGAPPDAPPDFPFGAGVVPPRDSPPNLVASASFPEEDELE